MYYFVIGFWWWARGDLNPGPRGFPPAARLAVWVPSRAPPRLCLGVGCTSHPCQARRRARFGYYFLGVVCVLYVIACGWVIVF